MKHGVFITFEGIDGSGKSTQLERAKARLEQEGVPLVVTREPGGTRVSERIRELVMAAELTEMSVTCEVLLYLAARAQHVTEVIKPALDGGKVVLCDRYQEATFAYQGFGRGVALDRLYTLNSFATGGTVPDLTFVFDVPVEEARRRLAGLGRAADRIENDTAEFHSRIREGYLAMASAHPDRMVLLDGLRDADEVAEQVFERIRQALG